MRRPLSEDAQTGSRPAASPGADASRPGNQPAIHRKSGQEGAGKAARGHAPKPASHFAEAQDWNAAAGLQLYCISDSDAVHASAREALIHPALGGVGFECLPTMGAEERIEALLESHRGSGPFPVFLVDKGPDTLKWCRSLAPNHSGDPWHCLALVDVGMRHGLWAADFPAALDVLPQPLRPEDLAVRLRYLGRLAAERARRIAAEREAQGMGLRLDESQNKLRLTRVLEEAVERLQRLSTTDGLTGITNRARFEEIIDLEWGQAVGDSFPLSLILIDIDYFKRYNDTYGHLLGDSCLQKVARALLSARESSRDIVARFGGEEFVVLLPGRDARMAAEVAERLRSEVEALRMPNANSPVSPDITLSAGVASAIPDLTSSAMSLVQKADRALYQAKREGRNRVCLDP